MARFLRLLLPVAVLLVLAACESDEARVRFAVIGQGALQPSMLSIQFSENGRRRVVSGTDFVVDGSFAQPHTRWYSTATAGTLTVDFTVRDAEGASVAEGEIELQLQPDWQWEVHFLIDDRNPALGCLGCIGHRAFVIPPPVATTPRDSLYVIWGGNSIKNPEVS
jgi:hypothetical protein